MSEYPINVDIFPPTYKYKNLKLKLCKRDEIGRLPGWADRIIYKFEEGHGIEVTDYKALYLPTDVVGEGEGDEGDYDVMENVHDTSDHIPVMLKLECKGKACVIITFNSANGKDKVFIKKIDELQEESNVIILMQELNTDVFNDYSVSFGKYGFKSKSGCGTIWSPSSGKQFKLGIFYRGNDVSHYQVNGCKSLQIITTKGILNNNFKIFGHYFCVCGVHFPFSNLKYSGNYIDMLKEVTKGKINCIVGGDFNTRSTFGSGDYKDYKKDVPYDGSCSLEG